MKYRIVFEIENCTCQVDYLKRLINEYLVLKDGNMPLCKSYLLERISNELVTITRINAYNVSVLDVKEIYVELEVTL